jgi:ATP adenylyltransferase
MALMFTQNHLTKLQVQIRLLVLCITHAEKEDSYQKCEKFMQTIWAPWRMEYILSEKSGHCFFCEKSKQTAKDRKNFVLYRGKLAFALMNIYPYNNGHLMIAPYAHVPSLTDLDFDQIGELFYLTQRCEHVLAQAIQPEGFNIGLNLGKVAGAGLEDHLHVHIVPRWNGDTNYMTTISNIRVIPQQLEETYERLITYFLKQE